MVWKLPDGFEIAREGPWNSSSWWKLLGQKQSGPPSGGPHASRFRPTHFTVDTATPWNSVQKMRQKNLTTETILHLGQNHIDRWTFGKEETTKVLIWQYFMKLIWTHNIPHPCSFTLRLSHSCSRAAEGQWHVSPHPHFLISLFTSNNCDA